MKMSNSQKNLWKIYCTKIHPYSRLVIDQLTIWFFPQRHVKWIDTYLNYWITDAAKRWLTKSSVWRKRGVYIGTRTTRNKYSSERDRRVDINWDAKLPRLIRIIWNTVIYFIYWKTAIISPWIIRSICENSWGRLSRNQFSLMAHI